MVQNAAARVLTRTRKYNHISPVMSTLHWLSIKHHIDIKILLITYKALNDLAPQYLREPLSHYSPPHLQQSQNSGHLIVSRISKSTAGGRSFFYLALKLWNNLPNTVREADTLCQFKSRLKTHLFNSSPRAPAGGPLLEPERPTREAAEGANPLRKERRDRSEVMLIRPQQAHESSTNASSACWRPRH